MASEGEVPVRLSMSGLDIADYQRQAALHVQLAAMSRPDIVCCMHTESVQLLAVFSESSKWLLGYSMPA